ncbi:AraC-like DNA-binding protein [Microbacterium resistens]|uniref:AraC-like DNA-binding protein n=1 Tax=Microbacterium resistens TaxID=156977 RepID=A0ABU1SBL5_9MICO|nr:AraC family transcriptional regulator [Microbacterium resistens]MDR6867002.1 AraC-like DNA-binding protein [Microbacterium resistens]
MSAIAPPAPAPARAQDERTGEAIEKLLSAVDVRIRRQQRITTREQEILAVPARAVTLIYVIAGIVRVEHGLGTSCTVPGREEVRPPSSAASLSIFTAGDVLLSAGRRAISVHASPGATVLMSTLDLADAAAHVADLLPDLANVRGFSVLEPAAAALAEHMGIDREAAEVPERRGDEVICRTMARTVLLSAIRAWSANGCAPVGWPSVSNDPYLDRVVDAIHAEPGRDWSVEGLAAVGAMSRSVFAERFRTALGRSPLGYVAEVRMRSAQELLRRGLGVSAVSRELGYSSDEGFSRAFRRHTGMTPSAWRTSRA